MNDPCVQHIPIRKCSEATRLEDADNHFLDGGVDHEDTHFEMDSFLEEEVEDTQQKQEHKEKPRDPLDDYEILHLLGVGAYGRVYKVREKSSGAIHAMKVLTKSDISRRKLNKYVHSERDTLLAVQHPFIVSLSKAFQTPSRLYLLMEYISGGELFARLSAEHRLPEGEALFYAAQLVLALEHLHANGILYRDLKPENILLRGSGNVSLTDFGFARSVKVQGARTFCGTVWYMSPERVRREEGYEYASDWWALGVVLYEMLVGTTPFSGGNRKEVQRRILECKPKFPVFLTLPVRNLLKRLLHKDPKHRLGVNGAGEIKGHKVFRDIAWNDLQSGKVKPPFIPDDSLDSKCIDKTTNNTDISDKCSLNSPLHFDGFSYPPPSPWT